MRIDQRKNDQMRPVQIELGVSRYAEGSALVKFGHTHILCTASLEPTIPKWLMGQGKGWVTAEYGMLPRSTHERMNRERAAHNPSPDPSSVRHRAICCPCDVRRQRWFRPLACLPSPCVRSPSGGSGE